jgi:hypothetical protein
MARTPPKTRKRKARTGTRIRTRKGKGAGNGSGRRTGKGRGKGTEIGTEIGTETETRTEIEIEIETGTETGTGSEIGEKKEKGTGIETEAVREDEKGREAVIIPTIHMGDPLLDPWMLAALAYPVSPFFLLLRKRSPRFPLRGIGMMMKVRAVLITSSTPPPVPSLMERQAPLVL